MRVRFLKRFPCSYFRAGSSSEKESTTCCKRFAADFEAAPKGAPVITGDGHYRAEWEELARQLGLGEIVRFAGFVSNEALSSLFQSCSIYVHPAIYDSKGDKEGQGVGFGWRL